MRQVRIERGPLQRTRSASFDEPFICVCGPGSNRHVAYVHTGAETVGTYRHVCVMDT